MTQTWTITGGEILAQGALTARPLYVANGLIRDTPTPEARTYDARGAWVLPGIVDLHGDGFEAIVQPRAGVHFPYPLAFAEADRQMLANGITTAFHALTVSWEPGLRSIEVARELVAALEAATSGLRCSTHLNIRWETFAVDHVAEVLGWLDRRPGDILSINDHTTANRALDAGSSKVKRMAARMGITPEETKRLIDEVWARRAEVPGATAQICAGASARGTPILSHDQCSAEDWAEGRDLGISVSEFPMTEAAAAAARDAGEPVILGAPNALRGLSHNGALCATSAISAGLCDVLASDYYYPAPLHAAFRLWQAGVLPMADAWALVSTNPARAAKLQDRGEIAPGKRADLIVVDPDSREVRAVFVAGRKVLDRV
ncbi:alpha-D-ribose 1-methylphosphonate 5-triphosphate diphosphatase [Salipiger sp. PrR002]|uniref:alpha-D-ribose 1-methylphosphonate 5-triphosphate diphosphatase n=1 Tax=Salipiger sp. PrR002 TaxID=2706489 RepID=UPI0013B627D8|nr:alpha-D-ribose 1-methylphosphonate 5-triphosphate diphosphatase [Salipiger sp. PrR002]NDW02500.1 alpha-D-ribose 1-methylphosphonate 5-triphosphate diphosphatase [Salipiger sp. PrR002]NDW56156.1 alpha-D-ribose 1-methylphosphonate 5-triphosphate diphosphatase [Salipiger sp. PrR004]